MSPSAPRGWRTDTACATRAPTSTSSRSSSPSRSSSTPRRFRPTASSARRISRRSSPRSSPSGGALPGPSPQSHPRAPAQADLARRAAARRAGVDAEVLPPRRRHPLRPAVLRQARRGPALAERLPDRRPLRALEAPRGRPLHEPLRGDRGDRRRRSRSGARVHRRGAPLRRRGHARGLRPRQTRWSTIGDDRLRQVRGNVQLRALRLSLAAARGQPGRALRHRGPDPARRSASRAASSTSSSSCRRRGRPRSSR